MGNDSKNERCIPVRDYLPLSDEAPLQELSKCVPHHLNQVPEHNVLPEILMGGASEGGGLVVWGDAPVGLFPRLQRLPNPLNNQLGYQAISPGTVGTRWGAWSITSYPVPPAKFREHITLRGRHYNKCSTPPAPNNPRSATTIRTPDIGYTASGGNHQTEHAARSRGARGMQEMPRELTLTRRRQVGGSPTLACDAVSRDDLFTGPSRAAPVAVVEGIRK